MRFLFGITYYLPHISGLTRALAPIAQSLAQRGNEVTVIAAKSDADLPENDVSDGIRIRRIPVSFWVGKGPVMLGLLAQFFRSSRDVDIVHLFLPQFDAALCACIGRLRGARVVLTYVCSFSAPGALGVLSVFAARTSHFVAGLAAHDIVALSEDYAQQSRFCRIFRKKLSYIPIPIPDYPVKALPRTPPKPPYRVGFVGRIAAEKNIELILDAIPLLRHALGVPFTVELVGPEDPDVSAPQRALMNRLDQTSAPELERCGKLTEDELHSFYEGIDVLVLPSSNRIEAYGLVQVEAMLRGTPCVTTDRYGMREPIRFTGFGQVFEQNNAESLANAIASVLTSDFDVSPEAIYDIFDPRHIVTSYEAIYAKSPK